MRKGLYDHKKYGYRIDDKETFMKVIYQPKGKAGEYCKLALNIYRGCEGRCSYCYVPAMTYTTRKDFHSKVIARKNIFESVSKEIHEFSGKRVFLSFISDPYPQIEKDLQLTRRILQLFYENKVIPIILTKSNFADRDFDLLKKSKGKYGATLTFINSVKSKHCEPGAAMPSDRIGNLEKAHSMGIETWASLEPVISTVDTLEIINLTYKFVDEYKIGKWNYSKEANKIDWHLFVNEAIKLLKSYNKKYYIKDDLKKYI